MPPTMTDDDDADAMEMGRRCRALVNSFAQSIAKTSTHDEELFEVVAQLSAALTYAELMRAYFRKQGMPPALLAAIETEMVSLARKQVSESVDEVERRFGRRVQ